MKEIKEENIESLAKEANKTMALNKYLKKKLDLYNKYINLTKITMTKYLSDKNNSPLNLCNSYIDELQKDYDALKEEYEKTNYPKYKLLLDECLNDISFGKPVLKQYKAEEFVLDYLKNEKQDLINALKKSIQQTKEFQIFREPKRDTIIDTKKSNKEIEKTTTELQQNMLYECKKCNKFLYKIKKYNYLIEEIKKNIKLLKKYKLIISTNNNTGQNDEDTGTENNKITFKMGKNSIKGSIRMDFLNPSFGNQEQDEGVQNNSDDERKGGSGEKYKTRKSSGLIIKKSFKKRKSNKKEKNKIISEFKKVEDLFNISSEEGENEKIIHDELHSDDETVFAEKIKQPKQLSLTYLDQVKKDIPEINLNQIEYNKLKIMNEADLYSLQRRKYKTQNIDSNIKDLKKKVEKMNEKISIIKQKEKIMKEYIEKVKDKIEVLKPYERQNTLIISDPVIIKKSLFEPENIDEVLSEDYVGSSEESQDKKQDLNKKKNILNNKKNIKKSVLFGDINRNDKKKKKIFLKQSVQDGLFNNKLRDKLKKYERTESK